MFEGLAENNCILELDVSWNSLGNSSEDSLVTAVGEFFVKNTTMKHIDFSYNSFNTEECQALSERIALNRDILGIHMAGNYAAVDTQGFIVTTTQPTGNWRPSRLLVPSGAGRNRSPVNCWVCEKWVEFTFEWPGSTQDPLFIHFSFENYVPNQMNVTRTGFSLQRAVPPSTLKFFFTDSHSTLLSTVYQSKDFPQTEGGVPHLMNYLEPSGAFCDVHTPFPVRPRSPHSVQSLRPEVATTVESESVAWSISVSVFKDYIFDTDLLLHDCASADLRESKIETLVKGAAEYRELARVLRKNYKHIREWYKVLAAYSAHTVVSIGYNTFTEFLLKCELLDHLFTQRDLGVHWGAVNVPKHKSPQLNPTTTLVRYEFLEMLVRIGLDRFYRNGLSCSVPESVEMLLDYVKPIMEESSPDKWRWEHYVTESTDSVLRAHKPVLDSLFSAYRTAGKNHMALEEFRSFNKDSGILNDFYRIRDIDVCFHSAMMTQKSELYSARHVEMKFVEFLEGIARAAWQANWSQCAELAGRLEAIMPKLHRMCPSKSN